MDETGAPVSAWHWAEALPENVEKAVNNAGQRLYDGTGTVVAWLLPLTVDDLNLRLLLSKQSTVSLFAPDDQDERYGLLWQAGNEEQVESGGVWFLAEGKVTTSSGSQNQL